MSSSSGSVWMSPAVFDVALNCPDLELSKRNLTSIDQFIPSVVEGFTVRNQRALLKAQDEKGLYVCKKQPDVRSDCVNMVVRAIQSTSANSRAFEKDEIVRRALGQSDARVKLGFQDKSSIDRLLVHITHLRRFRATVNPLHEFVQPVAQIKFEKKESSGSSRDIEYRAYNNSFKVPALNGNERYIVRLFGQRAPFQFQVSNVERKEIPKYIADEFETVAPTVDRYDGDFVDPAFAKMPHLHKHPGARGNNPVVYTKENYPLQSEDPAAHALLYEGTVLPWSERMQGRICVWINAKPVDVPFMEFKKYTTRLTNSVRKKAMPQLEGVDITPHLKTHTAGTTVSFEIAWSREDQSETDRHWNGVAVIEKVRVLTEQQLVSVITARPKVELLPSIDMSFNLEEEQKKRPRECFLCLARVETHPGVKLCRCSGCHYAWYCGREHQTEDWKTHRVECNRIRKIIAAQREAAASSGLQDEDDLEVDNSKVKVSLDCAISNARMKYPIKGIRCKHHTCSDLLVHISLAEKWGTLQCMQCYSPMLMEDISISQRMQHAIETMPESISDVTCPDNMAYQAVIPDQPAYYQPKRQNTGQSRFADQTLVSLAETVPTHTPTPKPVVEPNDVIELD